MNRTATTQAKGGLGRHVLIMAVLAAITWCVFFDMYSFEFIRGDDDAIVSRNTWVNRGITWDGAVWASTHQHWGNWMPLTSLSHMLDVELFGLWAGGHHLTGLSLHATNAALLYVALFLLTGRRWRSAFVAALFAVHPLRASSVAWIASRKDLTSALFFILALIAYARYSRKPGLWRYVPVAAAMALGLMAKPMLVTLPGVLLLLDWWPLERIGRACATRRDSLRTALRLTAEKIPLLLMSGAAAYVAVRTQEAVGAITPLAKMPLAERVGRALLAYTGYLAHFLAPVGLDVHYPVVEMAHFAWWVAGAAALLIGITAAVLAARRMRFLTLGWFWYLGMLLPVIGLVHIGPDTMADRYTYLPTIGLGIMAAWGIPALALRRKKSQPLHPPGNRRRWLLRVGAALVVAALMATARAHVAHYRNTETFWLRALAMDPDAAPVHTVLANLYFDSGRSEEALHHYREALRAAPQEPRYWYNLGCALLERKDYGQAAAAFEESVALAPEDASAHMNLGIALLNGGNAPAALKHLAHAAKLRPYDAHILLNHATALMQSDRPADAARQFIAVLALEPDNRAARAGLEKARQSPPSP